MNTFWVDFAAGVAVGAAGLVVFIVALSIRLDVQRELMTKEDEREQRLRDHLQRIDRMSK